MLELALTGGDELSAERAQYLKKLHAMAQVDEKEMKNQFRLSGSTAPVLLVTSMAKKTQKLKLVLHCEVCLYENTRKMDLHL